MTYPLLAIRGSFVDFVDDPFYASEAASVRYIPDGLMILENGSIKALDDYSQLIAEYPNLSITTYVNKLIMPGFIDAHIHLPQTEMIGAYGEQLLEWLDKYVFPTESKFNDPEHLQKIVPLFVDELLRNGTTTALVLAAVFPESADCLFEEAHRRNLRMIVGKVMMDRNAPEFLMDTAQSSYEDSKALIEKWHQRDRLLYAVTPRFAISCTPEELQFAHKLLDEYPNLYLHTHMSENLTEIKLTLEMFPGCQDYLGVYEHFGLLTERSVFAHCIHLSDSEFARLSAAGATIAFCPTSNLFLGSGLFKLDQAKSAEMPVHVALATDVGAGTSFSMLKTMGEAYKVAQLQRRSLSSFQAFYLATLGGARSLRLDDKIGNFDVGKEADFVVLDLQTIPMLAVRTGNTMPQTLDELADKLFAVMILGDDRTIHATYVAGSLAYSATPTA
jgi:guanine deaminase